MNTLHAGFSRVNITPPMGIEIVGYFRPRYASGVLDDLEINALALSAGEDKIVLLSADLCFISNLSYDRIYQSIQRATGLTKDQVFIHSTHTHTGPVVNPEGKNGMAVYGSNDQSQEIGRVYFQFLCRKFADAARMALADLRPAKMGWAVGTAPNIAFVRRFRMKDGKVKTNPGVGNPDILHPIGDVDERVNVLRFDREGAETIVLANFGCHPDVIGGDLISGDWPTLYRHRLEKSLDNVKTLFINGAEGDVNHINVSARDGALNGCTKGFSGYGHAQHMADVVAGAVLQVYAKVNYRDVSSIRSRVQTISVPSNMPKPEDMPLAHKYNDLHKAGRDNEIPVKAAELTTVVAEAARMVRLEHGPEQFELDISGIAIGPVALAGIPGEPFTKVGLGLKKAKGWDLVLPCCNINGAGGYFPMLDSYDEGGYEARSSRYKAGTAEQLVSDGVKLLNSLR